MVSPNPPPGPTVFEIDPEGDVTLILKSLDNQTPLSDEQTRINATHIRVSSKHLMTASRVFSRIFKPGLAEGDALQKSGSLELCLPDDNPHALLVLLNIAHLQLRNVPEILDLKTLTEISLLVDKYELAEATRFFSDLWLDRINFERNSYKPRELLQLVWISFVFRHPYCFQASTADVITKIRRDIRPKDVKLSIPERIFGKRHAETLSLYVPN